MKMDYVRLGNNKSNIAPQDLWTAIGTVGLLGLHAQPRVGRVCACAKDDATIQNQPMGELDVRVTVNNLNPVILCPAD